MGGSIILGSTFGIDIQGKDDPYITTAEKALHSLAVAGNAGSYMGARRFLFLFWLDIHDFDATQSTMCQSVSVVQNYCGVARSHQVSLLVRYLPSWAPGAQFKRDGARWKKDVTSMYSKPLEYVKQCLVSIWRHNY